MRQLINGLLSRFGYRICKWPIAKSLTADSNIAELLARHPVNTLFDVGAHRGETGRRFRSLGFSGRIISFEPSPDAYTELADAARRDGNWLAMNCALGERAETAELHVANSGVLSSLHTATENGASHFGTAIAEARSVTVNVETLNSLVANGQLGVAVAPIYLKIDTQGHDLAVLRGATDIFDRVHVLQVEAAVHSIYNDAPTFIDTYHAAVDAGFALTAFIPGSRKRSLAVNEMDAFFVRLK